MRKSELSRRITWRVIGIVSFFNVIIVGIIAVFIFVLSLENGGVRGQYVADGKKAMQDRLDSYSAGECPDMVLAASDNLAQGAIEALEEAGITNMPVITGQDNSAMSQTYIKSGKQTMTIDKNLKDMAYNTAMIVNGLISNSPVRTSQSISGIPAIYSKITVMTKDNY